jgi:hypothetical protein
MLFWLLAIIGAITVLVFGAQMIPRVLGVLLNLALLLVVFVVVLGGLYLLRIMTY